MALPLHHPPPFPTSLLPSDCSTCLDDNFTLHSEVPRSTLSKAGQGNSSLTHSCATTDRERFDSLVRSLSRKYSQRSTKSQAHSNPIISNSVDSHHSHVMAPQQPAALPPTYIMDFIMGVFTKDLCLVDFTQAVTAVDQARDLEARRRSEMTAALERLDIDASTLDAEKERLKEEQPLVAEWVASIVDKAKRIESLYTQVFIGLRRWTLINEMRLEPFNKANCIAMLNILYPTNSTAQPSSSLTPMILNQQRNAFFRYILSVETNGKNVLAKLEQQGKRPQDANAWPIVRDVVENYLRKTNQLIEACTSIHSAADVQVQSQPMDKRTDSGISLDSSKSGSSYKSSLTYDKIRPSITQPSFLDVPRSRSGSSASFHRKSSSNGEPIPLVRPEQLRQKEVRKVGSTLERLARELKRMRSRSNDRSPIDRPESRSRGSSASASEADEIHQFSISHAPIPPSTATTAYFPESLRDDDHITPLPSTTRTHTKSLKKIKSAGNLQRDSTVSYKFAAPSTPRLPNSSGNMLTLQAMGAERKFSVPTVPSLPAFSITEEERTRMIVRAKAEKESAQQRERHSPIRSRSDTIETARSGASSGSEQGKMHLDAMPVPVRRTSPGRNKLRDYFGVDTLQVPTNFAN